jgi:hypothetical protein
MADKIWDLANLITGFAVVQGFATILLVVKGELRSLRGIGAHAVACVLTAVSTTLYVLAVRWCNAVGLRLNKGENADIWSMVSTGRCVAGHPNGSGVTWGSPGAPRRSGAGTRTLSPS